MTERTKGYALGALSAASYGVNPFAVLMYDDGMTVDEVLFYRYALAALLLGGLILARGESLSLTLKETGLLLAGGLIFSLSSITLFLSYQYIDVSIASTLLFCYPALVAIIMMIFFGERPNLITIGAIVAVGIGIALLNSGGDGSADNILGVIVVVLSSLSYAIYIVGVQKTDLRYVSSLKVGFYSIVFGSLIYIVRLRFGCDLHFVPTMRSGICVMVLAVFPTIISITALAKSVKYIGPTDAAIMGAIEPVTAVLIGVVAFSERPTPLAILGMIIVFIAVTMLIAAPKIKRLFKGEDSDTDFVMKAINTKSRHYSKAEKLLESEFPDVERRPRKEQRHFADTNNLFHANAIFSYGKFAGLINIWDFDDFVYVEHLATHPSMREKGLASEALSEIKRLNKPIILEVEPPVDTKCQRRVVFYERNGFQLLDTPYMQPAYSPELAPVELRLMVCGDGIDVTHAVEMIRHHVYGAPPN